MDLFPPYFLKKKKSYKITKSICPSLKNETMSETVQKKVILGVRVPCCKRDTGRDLALTTLEITTFSAPGYLITCIYINVNVIFSGNLKKSYLLNACPPSFSNIGVPWLQLNSVLYFSVDFSRYCWPWRIQINKAGHLCQYMSRWLFSKRLRCMQVKHVHKKNQICNMI